MTGLVKMLGRVLVLGRIAAADMATLETQPQVDPGIVHFQALFAALAAGFHLFDVLLMSTSLSHRSPHNFLNAANASCKTASAANVWKRLGSAVRAWNTGSGDGTSVSTQSAGKRIQKFLKQLDDG
jgi:hypothetical protein